MRHKIMLVAIGTAGDVFPFIGLGRALAMRGNEVHLLSFDQYRSFITSAGLVFHSIHGVSGATGDPAFYHPTQSIRLIASRTFLPSVRPVYEFISQLDHRQWKIISGPTAFGARIAQECRRFRLTTCVVGPFILRSIQKMPVTPGLAVPDWAPAVVRRAFFRLVSRLWDRELGPQINILRRELGLEPVTDIFYGWSLSPDRVIGLFSEWFAPRPADWPPQFVYGGFAAYDQGTACELPEALLAPGDPLVVFCAGSAGNAAASFMADGVAASRGRSWRAVLLAPGCTPKLPLPPNVLQCGYIPLSRLLPRAAAIVHHGGLGAISTAFGCGVPQIAVPLGHDQFDNAARIERLGAGYAVTSRFGRASRIANAIQTLLASSGVRDRCRSIGQRSNSESALASLCDLIESANF